MVEQLRPLSPHQPHPIQSEFLGLDCEEAFYGGAAGGGKSDALIMAALQHVDVPGYSAALFRLTQPDMMKPGAILDRAHSWLKGTAAEWDQKAYGYRFPSSAFLHFGYAASYDEVSKRYQGPEFQFIGVDELPQWDEKSYRYLFSRLRRLKGAPVPIRMRGAGNPGGRGHQWVKRRFVEFARHGRGTDARADIRAMRTGVGLPSPRVYYSPPSPEALEIAALLGRRPQRAAFVPAFAADNQHLDVAQYRSALMQLDPATREMLEHGNWDADTGTGLFKTGWFKYEDAPPAGLRWLRFWDLAATKQRPELRHDPDWTAGVKMAFEHKGEIELGGQKVAQYRVWVAHCAHFREDPGETESNVRATAESDGRACLQVFEQEPGASGKSTVHHYKTGVLFGWPVEGLAKTGPKEAYWKPVSAQASAGNVTLIRGPWNQAFVDELCALGTPGVHDDQADAFASGFAILAGVRADVQRILALSKM